MRVQKDEWSSASNTWGISMARLREQATSTQRFIPIDPNIGFNPAFGLMAHQAVGADVLHDLTFGPLRGSVQQDYMGMGKTMQVLSAFFMNLVLTFEAHNNGSTLPPNQRLRLDKDGLFKNRSPRVGATFLSAYSNGVSPWPRDWAQMMKDSPLLKHAPAEWRPKMFVLHESGKKLCDKYGGEANGLFSELTAEDLREMFPAPDWNNARAPWSFPYDITTGQDGDAVNYDRPSSWVPHPKATTSQPSPTSARFFILSTNKSWQSRVYDIAELHFKLPKDFDTAYKAIPRKNVAQLRDAEAKRRKLINDKIKGRGDGYQKNQARRPATWAAHDGKQKRVDMVCDLLYAAWVVIDEIHSAGSDSTITYSLIIDRFNLLVKDPALRPSFTAITGSAMANGINTILTFALKGLRRNDPAWKQLSNPTVQLLQKRNYADTQAVWIAFEKQNRKKNKLSMAARIEADPKMQDLLNTFAAIIGTYFIGRDYNSIDMWGRKLNLMDCELKENYVPVLFGAEYHKMLKDVESNIQAQLTRLNEEALAEWKDNGGTDSGKPKPKPRAPERADKKGYQKARVMASFPNFINAIYKYQAANPEVVPIIGSQCEWVDSLGQDNLELSEILKNPTNIKASIIFDAIDDICEGSEKMSHILFIANRTSRETTTAPHPIDRTKPDIKYQSKYCIASTVRLSKAIIYAVSPRRVCALYCRQQY